MRFNQAITIIKKFDNKRINRFIKEDNTNNGGSSKIKTSLSVNRKPHRSKNNSILKKKKTV